MFAFAYYVVFVSNFVSQVNIVSVDDQEKNIDFLLHGRKHPFVVVYAYVTYHMHRTL